MVCVLVSVIVRLPVYSMLLLTVVWYSVVACGIQAKSIAMHTYMHVRMIRADGITLGSAPAMMAM